MRLSLSTASSLTSSVPQPAYDRDKMGNGIVHFGLGAFTRAHQIAYTDDAMNAGDHDWMITGISLRSAAVREKLSPQDGLYLLAEQGAESARYRLIGALRDVLVVPDQATAVITLLADPATHVVTLTITEKGYHRGADGKLDMDHADVAHDLEGLEAPRTIYGLLHAAIERRRQAGARGFTLVCCDNLPSNGRLLQSLIDEYLSSSSNNAAEWFRENCSCPSTMVDRIVPATTQEDISATEKTTGLHDAGLVVTEPFRQWVIEDRFVGPRPKWDVSGAQFVVDVKPYETAKLRMLNGAHSALAYIGLERGYEYVHQAIADAYLRGLVEKLMKEEAAPTIAPANGQDLGAYADALVIRFENPALNHSLVQIAEDGSQKIPQRWLQTLAAAQSAQRECSAIMTALAHWLCHIRGDRRYVADPIAETLASIWRHEGVNGIVQACFVDNIIRSEWRPTPSEMHALVQMVATIDSASR